MKLALFDLDHTLIPFDSGMAWTRFLVARGVLPAEAETVYLGYCQQYVDGTLDIRELHRASVAPLASFGMAALRQWAAEFEAEIASQVPEPMRALVRQHQDAGHVCAIVTATTRFIAEPFGRLFGVADVLATRSLVIDDTLDGAIDGDPCYGVHKLMHVNQWLATRGTRLEALEQSWFYSDSASDLPLLCAVSDPVAVAPDDRLRARAAEAGWPIIERTPPAAG
ncbi:HAD superfamily hydrolase (TIGR01490 family) [Variovorax beijingensis]|jgi:HAD superfamily hydrolase (TIGR01490 family)|uniref:HAD superfamily hydrolase (TIGR01490 family) n=2 Tax=Variovorax TaxID=34072 RepID=A0AAE4BZ42_VARPD|nr:MULTISPECIES: HAD family phosphatase [Variovorax]MBD9664070.1 HAD family phosphatase [Variovorax sp. VRV01]MDP9964946.1 HAD superfamily hydrolase (TIGR01490 family) [Variovorax paradoxus]MDR6428553.1 HAD superfamily hydrolase (TIGR01490 family) [Variovorax paradoxus]MDR6455207.1 HAD superfamily hydrolase (TIGR01490 family) [Variovorax paradoxus]TWD85203.1 HAD superfamily hydrolase (TIGR01490 family) [Variovorax beijingensis]